MLVRFQLGPCGSYFAITEIKASNLTRLVPFERFSFPQRTLASAYRTWRAGSIKDLAEAFVSAIALHRHWEREPGP